MHPRDYAAFTQPVPTLSFSAREEESARALSGTICHSPGKQATQLVQTAPSGLIRTQQLLVLQNLRIPAIPAYSGSDGGWVLDRVLASVGGASWWATLTGRYRLQRLISQRRGDPSVPWLDSFADPSNTALGARLRWAPTKRMALSAVAEVPVATRSAFQSVLGRTEEQKLEGRGHAAGLPSLRMSLQRKGTRHLAAAAAALDCDFLEAPSEYRPVMRHLSAEWGTRSDLLRPGLGLQYRLGLSQSQKDGSEAPSSLAQAGFAWDARAVLKPKPRAKPVRRRSKNPSEERATPGTERMRKMLVLPPKEAPGNRRSFSLFLAQPSLKFATSLGAVAQVPLDPAPTDKGSSSSSGLRLPIQLPSSAAVHPMGSMSVSAQVGRFSRVFLDYTEVAARVDLGLSSRLGNPVVSDPGSGALAASQASHQQPEHAAGDAQSSSLSRLWKSMSPEHSLTLSLAQQVIGPLRLRADIQLVHDQQEEFLRVKGAKLTQAVYGADCMVPGLMGSARLAAWYSPTRKEGMAELRLF